jgi:hypothetical protein
MVPDDFPTIQIAIDAALTGDTVVVAPGIYDENVSFLGKNITVMSTDPDAPSVVESTIIDGGGRGSTVIFDHGEGTDAVLCGFTIRGGFGTVDHAIDEEIFWGAGIYCNGASPTITQNIIKDNYGPDTQNDIGYGGGISCIASNAVITRNLITRNYAYAGGGMMVYICQPIIANNIICDNSATIGGGVILLLGGNFVHNTVAGNSAQAAGNLYAASDENYPIRVINSIIANAAAGSGVFSEALQYVTFASNNVWGNAGGDYDNLPTQTGLSGNISAAPLFYDIANNDYRLMAESPCIDSGNNALATGLPLIDFGGQARPIDGDFDGEAIVDIGAYEAQGPTCPMILVTTSDISFAAVEGTTPDAKTLTVSNGGPEVLYWTIEESCGWLDVTPAMGSSVGPDDGTEIAVSIDISGMPAGVYTCGFDIVDTAAVNSPKTINVTVYICNAGEIVVPVMYSTIQQAIDESASGSEIVVAPGVYREAVHFGGKNLVLRSVSPDDWDIVKATVIQGTGTGSVVTFSGTEDASCLLSGFTVRGGATNGRGGGICGNRTQAQIAHCLVENNTADTGGGIADCDGIIDGCVIRSNTAAANGGGLVFCGGEIRHCLITHNSAVYGGGLQNCDGLVINCTVAGNIANEGGGLRRCDGTLLNSIFWGNDGDNLFECALPTYSCFPGAVGLGNIAGDPLFVDASNMDYHLKSEGWRWDTVSGQWLQDAVTSPCIDTGNPAMLLGEEPITLDVDPDNLQSENIRINMGAYGETAKASIAPLGWALLSDLDNSGSVEFGDLVVMAGVWLETGQNLPADISRDGTVSMGDLLRLSRDWLKTRTVLEP